MVRDALTSRPGGQNVLEESQTTKTLDHRTRRDDCHLSQPHPGFITSGRDWESHRVAHNWPSVVRSTFINKTLLKYIWHVYALLFLRRRLPTRQQRERYALGIMTLFPSLRDPFPPKGYIAFAYRLKTVSRKTSLRPIKKSISPQSGGPTHRRKTVLDHQLSCCSIEDHLDGSHGRQPYLLAVGRRQSKIDNYYIMVDKRLVSCQATFYLTSQWSCLCAFDELFNAHFVFNLTYDDALVNFYIFVQTTIYNIDVDKNKRGP
ncbi:uncharacterized protein [Salvelinus sp. IW2-2015]|uniref:uncharacterized protein n=1 Tax=Salvelinus sp. IW2-2015 TaxID=2691554 RepID=UPI0038D4D202